MAQQPPPQIVGHISETLVLIISGLGLVADPPAFVGGLFMAAAGATLSRLFAPEQTRRRLAVTLSAGLFVAILAALAVQSLNWNVSIQFTMGGAGFLATFFLPWILRRFPSIADRLIDRRLDK